MLSIAIVHECSLLSPQQRGGLTRWLKPRFATVAELAGARRGEVTLAIVDDARMSQLHASFKGVSGTTDVLTFDMREAGKSTAGATGATRITRVPGDAVAVDVVLCLDEARRQAAARGHDWRLELLLYALHGLLHVRGYDDLTARKAQRMHQREDEILRQAGFGTVFECARLHPQHKK